MNRPIVLYDGACNLCSGVVTFTLQRNGKEDLIYAAMQSETGRALLQAHGLTPGQAEDTFVFVEDGRAYVKSTAALRLARHLDGVWQFAGLLLVLPQFLRDVVYSWIAANRYRWFGKKASCMLMKPEYRDRFLE